MSLHLYNSLTRRLEAFAPLDPACPTMYLCGPTVYNYVHIGNARGPVVFGVLAGVLRRRYGALRYARNITDVDDKINAAAKDIGAPISTITDRFTAAYREDMAALGVDAPDLEPAATAHIPQIITMIEQLIANGNAYAAEQHVLFSVSSFTGYGKLSRRDTDDMIAGARVEVAPYKRDPGDFVLWKPSTDDLPGWDSPWGRGRPGWHIECSAMAAAHLGETIDIHAGGVDLQFPHHENEIAQSECAHGGRIFARWWLHNGMLNFGGAKMSKSVGNIEKVHDLVRAHPPEALRYALLSAHYRQPLEWSDALIEQSRRTLDRLYGTLRNTAEIEVSPKIPEIIENALDDDLNTPMALAELASINRALARYSELIGHVKKTLQSLDFNHLRAHVLTRADAKAHLSMLETAGVYSAEVVSSLSKRLDEGDPPEELLRFQLSDSTRTFTDIRARLKAQLLGAGLALGLLQQDPDRWFTGGQEGGDLITALRFARRRARAAKDFELSDMLRDQLSKFGVTLKDKPDGTDQAIFEVELNEQLTVSSQILVNNRIPSEIKDKILVSAETPDIFSTLSREELLSLLRDFSHFRLGK